MKAQEAKCLFERNKINPLLYSFGEVRSTQCDVIENRDGVWSVFYWERGAEHFRKEFPDEASAVSEFIDCVVRSASLNERRKIVLE